MADRHCFTTCNDCNQEQLCYICPTCSKPFCESCVPYHVSEESGSELPWPTVVAGALGTVVLLFLCIWFALHE